MSVAAPGLARTFHAVVLAGVRKSGDPVAAARGVDFKCLVPVAGRAMLLRVVEALAASPRINRIVLVGDAKLVPPFPELAAMQASGQLILVAPEASPSRSVRAALERLAAWPVLVTTADHPLLTPDLVQRFLDGLEGRAADLAAGLTPAEAILARFPESRRTWWKFRDGRFSGANMFALMDPAALAAVDFWRRVEEERKKPWRIARLFGFGNLLAYLSGRLDLEGAFARASTVIGARAIPVSLPVAEAAIDVDKLEDLELVEKILASREGSRG